MNSDMNDYFYSLEMLLLKDCFRGQYGTTELAPIAVALTGLADEENQ